MAPATFVSSTKGGNSINITDMRTIAFILSTVVSMTIIVGAAFAGKPNLPRHKTTHITHIKLEHKQHVFTKGERQMRKLQCGNSFSKPGYDNL